MTKKKMKVFILGIIILCMLSLLVLLGIEIFKASVETESRLSDMKVSYSLSKQDSTLISNAIVSRITQAESYHFRNKEPLTIASIQNDYTLVIHKLTVDESFSLKNSVHLEISKAKSSTGYSYIDIKDSWPLEIRYLTDLIRPSSLIYLTIDQDSFHTDVKSDTLLGYSFQIDNLSIRYSKESPVEILIQKQVGLFDNDKPMFVSTLFWKNKSGVYLFFLIDSKKDQNTNKLTLTEIIRYQ